MRLDTLKESSSKPSGFIELFFMGLLTLVFLWLFKYVGLFLVDKGILYRGLVIRVLIGLPITWLLGHLVVQSFVDPEVCTCRYEFRYFWTEWLHKRKCLSYTVNGQ